MMNQKMVELYLIIIQQKYLLACGTFIYNMYFLIDQVVSLKCLQKCRSFMFEKKQKVI